MAVDKSYGSGKSRSAANSRARRRAAAGNFTKGAKPITRALKKIAAENPITGFIGGGIVPAKLFKVASALSASGQVGRAAAVRARAAAIEGGRNLPKTIALAEKMWTRTPGSSAPTPKTVGKTLVGTLRREASESVFPRATSSTKASPRLQKVADTITKRHYADVAKKGIGHGDAVNMPRAQVLRNLKEKRGIQINKPR